MSERHIEYNSVSNVKIGIFLFALALLLGEVLLISAQFDAQTLVASEGNPLVWLLRNSALMIQWLSVAGAAYLIIYLSSKDQVSINMADSVPASRLRTIGINLGSYLIFYIATYVLFEKSVASGAGFWLAAMVWCTSGLAVFLSILAVIQPLSAWFETVLKLKGPLLISMLLATVLTASSLLSKNLWHEVILPTFAMAEWLLSLFEHNVISIPDELYLGVDDFIVHVSPTCSGIEGMGLATGFTLLYLYLFKDKLVFPRAFILVPIAALLSWFFNVLRIAILILLGRYISPEFAVGGFHSQAGWFFFITLVLLIIYTFNKVHWFKLEEKTAAPAVPLKEDLPSSILICFILFLVGALIAGFDQEPLNWLYPVKVLLGGLPLILLWKTLNISMPSRIWEATGLGVLVCFVWVLLIPADNEFNVAQKEALTESGWIAIGVWIVFRFVGSILVAPLVEELFFRSYLLARTSSEAIDHNKPMPFHLLGLAMSSLAFAFIHQNWVAGGIAGAVYAFARYRGNLSTAVWAHGITNAMLCVYAVAFGQWSYL